MGYDATCTLVFDGKTSKGRAHLEHKELVFRGGERLTIPLADISKATAENGTLHVRFGRKSATLTIGSAAEKWAQRITSPPSRLDKLGVKPETTIAALGIGDREFLDEASKRARSLTTRTPAAGKRVDMIFYGAEHRDALERLPGLATLLHPAGALWIVRPKGRQEITEAETMAAGKRAGLVDVKVVSFSETHTAEKFVIPVAKRRP